jgi:membrane protein implicated in regulation of membrane protease activity
MGPGAPDARAWRVGVELSSIIRGMDWWMWIAGGLALVVAELATPSGFFIIFFGLSALTVGLLTGLNVVGAAWAQWLLFSALSVAYILVFRRRLESRMRIPPPPNVDSLVGVLAIVQERLLPGVVGKVEVRGSMWSARNTSSVILDAGQRARVTAVDGLTLAVIPE